MDHWFHRLKFILAHPFSRHSSIFKVFTFHKFIFRTAHYHRYFVLLERERKETGQTRSQNVRTHNVRCYFFSKLYMHLSTRDINVRASLKTGPVNVAD